MKDFSDRIITLRNYFNLNGEKFAKKIKISTGYLSKVETGKNIFSRKVVNRIVTEFGVNRFWIEAGQEPMFVENGPPLANQESIVKFIAKGEDMEEVQKMVEDILRVPRIKQIYLGMITILHSVAMRDQNHPIPKGPEDSP